MPLYIGNTEVNPSGIDMIYVGNTLVYENAPAELTALCFTAKTAGSKIELIRKGSPSISNTAYSTDGINWISFTPSTSSGTNRITLTNVGDKVYFRNDVTGNFTINNYMQFKMSGSIAASGNCNSMYVSTGFNELTSLVYEMCFTRLFYSCSSLTTPPALPATTVSMGAYYLMFSSSSIKKAPKLPATTLNYYCYYNMFSSCTSLTIAPTLPANSTAQYCYDGMFYNCTSLTKPPLIFATTLDASCYQDMFRLCTSLTAVPELPATTLARNCYYYMFNGCTSLQVSDTQTSEATHAWTIPTSGTFTSTYSQSGMFSNCLGTRSSNAMAGEQGQSYTYYTQNEPI